MLAIAVGTTVLTNVVTNAAAAILTRTGADRNVHLLHVPHSTTMFVRFGIPLTIASVTAAVIVDGACTYPDRLRLAPPGVHRPGNILYVLTL